MPTLLRPSRPFLLLTFTRLFNTAISTGRLRKEARAFVAGCGGLEEAEAKAKTLECEFYVFKHAIALAEAEKAKKAAKTAADRVYFERCIALTETERAANEAAKRVYAERKNSDIERKKALAEAKKATKEAENLANIERKKALAEAKEAEKEATKLANIERDKARLEMAAKVVARRPKIESKKALAQAHNLAKKQRTL